MKALGFRFLADTTWDSGKGHFTVIPLVVGTLTTSGIAILLGVPISIGIAIYLSELSPAWVREPLSFVIELLAAVPSVIYGLWGIYFLAPVLSHNIDPILVSLLGWTHLFQGTAGGFSKLTAGVILAIMIIPTVASISKEAMMAVPNSQREAALSLGATRYQSTRIGVLTYARSGIFGAAILGLGRAVGETMAVAMTIGNSPKISWNLLDPGTTMASMIANNWGEDLGDPFRLSVLLQIGVVLFVVALLINVFARLVIGKAMKPVQSGGAGL
jgi:phosphate transport system permease protein